MSLMKLHTLINLVLVMSLDKVSNEGDVGKAHNADGSVSPNSTALPSPRVEFLLWEEELKETAFC